MAFIVIKRPFLAVFPKRKRLQWQIFAPAASPSVSRHGASLQVSPESARNQLSRGGPETPFFLLLALAEALNKGTELSKRDMIDSRASTDICLTPTSAKRVAS